MFFFFAGKPLTGWVYALIYTDLINSFDHRDDDVRRLCVDPVGLFYQQHT